MQVLHMQPRCRDTHQTYLQGLHLDAGSRTVANAPPLLSYGRQKRLEGRRMWLQHLQCASLISAGTIKSYMLQAVPTRPLKSMEVYAALNGFLHDVSWQVSLPCQGLPPFALCVLHSSWLSATARPAAASPPTAPTRQHQPLQQGGAHQVSKQPKEALSLCPVKGIEDVVQRPFHLDEEQGCATTHALASETLLNHLMSA